MPGASFVLLPEAPEAPASRQMAPLVHLQPAQAFPDALPRPPPLEEPIHRQGRTLDAVRSRTELCEALSQTNNWVKGPSDNLLLLLTCRWADPGCSTRTKGAVSHNIVGSEVISLG